MSKLQRLIELREHIKCEHNDLKSQYGLEGQ